MITTTYDAAGRLATKANGLVTTTYTYDQQRSGYFNRGHLTAVDIPAYGATPRVYTELDYEPHGLLAGVHRWIGSDAFSVVKGYDAIGRPQQTSFGDNDVFGPFTYDAAGRFYSATGLVTSVQYDAAGRPLEQVNANSSRTQRTFDAARGWLERIETTAYVPGGPTTIQLLDYTDQYDPAGRLNVSQGGAAYGIAAGNNWSYDYDAGGLLKAATKAVDTPGVQTLTYDPGDRIKTNSRAGGYAYEGIRPHAPHSVGGVVYGYDNNGNLQSDGARTMTWWPENWLASVTTSSGRAEFTYDDSGERVRKLWQPNSAVPPTITLYPFGEDYEFSNGVTTKYFSVPGLGVVAKRVTGGSNPGTFWLHTDRLGSIQRLTGAPYSEPTTPQDFRPYGELLSGSATTDSRGWIDQRADAETGLVYLHARYYDPKLAIFLSPDPIGVAGGTNLYGYGLGDPVNAVDRSGLNADSQQCSWSVFGFFGIRFGCTDSVAVGGQGWLPTGHPLAPSMTIFWNTNPYPGTGTTRDDFGGIPQDTSNQADKDKDKDKDKDNDKDKD